MTPREIVERTLSYRNPPRVARSFYDSDLLCVNNSVCDVIKQADISQIADYELADYSGFKDYQIAIDARAANKDKWLLGKMPRCTFSMAGDILGFENHLAAISLQRNLIKTLYDKIDVALGQQIVNYAKAGADGIFILEDWGNQTGLLINPDLWYEEFFPRFQKLCGTAHSSGVKVFMHSCGKIDAIMPGLIKAGIDVFQFDQPELHGIDRLAEYQKQSKITFWCPVDIQKILPTRDEKAIRAEAKEMLDKLWIRHGATASQQEGTGGFIAGYYTDNAAIGLEPKWQNFACQEFLACGKC